MDNNAKAETSGYYLLDRTWQEIHDALDSNKRVVVRCLDRSGYQNWVGSDAVTDVYYNGYGYFVETTQHYSWSADSADDHPIRSL